MHPNALLIGLCIALLPNLTLAQTSLELFLQDFTRLLHIWAVLLALLVATALVILATSCCTYFWRSRKPQYE
ncbi:hypothetical protein CRM22_003189 [Opisthorchis felineus]|uniref:Uncharacterized protein n=1 Tax=Opisthorchis felineus TaxID=147828 RepID=A0A4S2M2J0_OPIFE|nr:hypothetical protein CRM22_003189 [Opisthorchis felineus]TGZ70452.1 hypothetical protein CRM22_003189 [Opisthorchis felineus]